MTQMLRPAAFAWPLILVAVVGIRSSSVATAPADKVAAGSAHLDARFDTVVKPFLETYCVDCHSGRKAEAELHLDALTSLTATTREPRWGLILERLENKEMPAPEADVFP